MWHILSAVNVDAATRWLPLHMELGVHYVTVRVADLTLWRFVFKASRKIEEAYMQLGEVLYNQ